MVKGIEQSVSKEEKNLGRFKIIAIIVSIAFVIGAAISFFLINNTTNAEQEDKLAGQAAEQAAEPKKSQVEQTEEEPEQESDLEPEQNSDRTKKIDEDVEKTFPLDMSQSEIETAIHKMSHQKVKAQKKWGALQITDERVERLIEVVEANNYNNSSIYLSILNRWAEGDFSKVDHDHNEIWSLQGGTVGRATGILSEEEERQYIESNFN